MRKISSARIWGKNKQLSFSWKSVRRRHKNDEIFSALPRAKLLKKKRTTLNAFTRDPFRSKHRLTGNLGMTTSKASMQIAAAMWSLRPPVILCLKIKMLWERRMTNLTVQSTIHVYYTKIIYVHEVIAKISQKNELKKFLAFQLRTWLNKFSLYALGPT